MKKWIVLVTPVCVVIGVVFSDITIHGNVFVPIVFAIMTFIGALKSTFQDDVVTIYHGNGPLSLSLVIVDTLLAPFLIPLTLRILVGSRIRVDTAGMMEELILMIALPAILAMAFNQVSKGKVKEELLAAVGYLLGWLGGSLLHGNEKTKISMIYGVGMRNISAGAVIASAYFPAEVVFQL